MLSLITIPVSDLANTHAVKLPTEIAQVLCSALHNSGADIDWTAFPRVWTAEDVARAVIHDGNGNSYPAALAIPPYAGVAKPYGAGHRHHPLVRWAQSSRARFLLLCNKGVLMCSEYSGRYERDHGARAVIEWCIQWLDVFPASMSGDVLDGYPLGRHPVDGDVFESERNICRAKMRGSNEYNRIRMEWPGAVPGWVREEVRS